MFEDLRLDISLWRNGLFTSVIIIWVQIKRLANTVADAHESFYDCQAESMDVLLVISMGIFYVWQTLDASWNKQFHSLWKVWAEVLFTHQADFAQSFNSDNLYIRLNILLLEDFKEYIYNWLKEPTDLLLEGITEILN